MSDKKTEHDPKLLMSLAKNDDMEAFGQLYQLYFVPVFRYIYFRVRNRQEAEDLVQTVFLKVLQSVHDFQEKGTSPLAYFFRVSRNAIIDYWRKKKELPFSEPDILINAVGQAKNPQELSEMGEDVRMVHGAIQRLTQEQQEVIVLKFINELSNQEIAQLLHKTEQAVRQLQCRALKALRKYLKNL